MGRRHGQRKIADTGRLLAAQVAHEGRHPRLVVGQPERDAIAEAIEHRSCVLAETGGCVTVRPATFVLQRLREVPVKERDERFDPTLEQAVDEASVEIDTGLIELPFPRRHDARPGDREAVEVDAELGE